MSNINKKAANQMMPGDLFKPGEYIIDEMEARGMKQVELANELGISKSEMSLIISGKRKITIAIALKLEKIFEINAETWMNLQVKYDIDKYKMNLSKELESAPIPQKRIKELKNRIMAA